MAEVVCRLDDPGAEEVFKSFRDGVCGGRRYALLYSNGDGIRCKLENSGRCLETNTPWRMMRFVLDPLFRFDPTVEWVALMPVEGWKDRCDKALADSMENGKPWGQILAQWLAGELATLPHLRIIR